MSDNYENIERPFGVHLEREAENLIPSGEDTGSFGVSGGDGAGTTNPQGGGSSEEQVIKNAQNFGDVYIKNWIKSLNWKPRKQGFYIDGGTGYAEFANIYITGQITLDESAFLAGGQSAFDTGTGFFLGYSDNNYKFSIGNSITGPKMTWDGSALRMFGVDVLSPGLGSDIATLTWTYDATFSKTPTTVAWSAGTITFQNTLSYAINAGTTVALNDNDKYYIYFDKDISTVALQQTTVATNAIGSNKILIGVVDKPVGKDPTYQIFGGAGGIGIDVDVEVPASASDWIYGGVFSATNNTTVAWTGGNMQLSDGTTFVIPGSNTGAMAATTYIYFDTTSPNQFFFTTTPATAVGANKILIAVAKNVADATKQATFQVFGGTNTNSLITADQIAANTITANELAATLLYAGTLQIDTNGSIRSGMTAYNTGTGLWIGNDGGVAKFSFGIGGQDDNNIRWDGTKLIVNGYEQTGLGTYAGNGIHGDAVIGPGTYTTGAGGFISVVGGEAILDSDILYQFNSLTILTGGTLRFVGPNIARVLVRTTFEMQASSAINLIGASNSILQKIGGVVGVHALYGGSPLTLVYNSIGGLISVGDAASGGAGGSSIGAGAGSGGPAGVNHATTPTNGSNGVDGTTGVTGGGGAGAGGGLGTSYIAPAAGLAAVGLNGGNGGAGGTTSQNAGSGGSGGGGAGTGNGGNGGAGGRVRAGAETTTRYCGRGGNGGASGPLGGFGGAGGVGGSFDATLSDQNRVRGGDGGDGGDGYAGGGAGGAGGAGVSGGTNGNSTRGGNGGNGGRGYLGNGGVGGRGGDAERRNVMALAVVSAGDGGNGGDGLNGGNGGNGGFVDDPESNSQGSAGDGGNGGRGANGVIPLFIFAGTSLILNGTITASGGNGGIGGDGGEHEQSETRGGDAGNGGDAGDGADVFILTRGDLINNGITVLNRGGQGGRPGTPGRGGNTGFQGRNGADGQLIIGKLTI